MLSDPRGCCLWTRTGSGSQDVGPAVRTLAAERAGTPLAAR
jgi:hypothetical protein